jgi:hypothetical protein
MGTVKYDPKYAVPVFKKVIITSTIAKIINVLLLPYVSINCERYQYPLFIVISMSDDSFAFQGINSYVRVFILNKTWSMGMIVIKENTFNNAVKILNRNDSMTSFL